MKEKNLQPIAAWERCKPETSTFVFAKFKNGLVTKVVGYHDSFIPCFWDGFGFAYHLRSRKRFKRADINFN